MELAFVNHDICMARISFPGDEKILQAKWYQDIF
jgi:hypothetical protein